MAGYATINKSNRVVEMTTNCNSGCEEKCRCKQVLLASRRALPFECSHQRKGNARSGNSSGEQRHTLDVSDLLLRCRRDSNESRLCGDVVFWVINCRPCEGNCFGVTAGLLRRACLNDTKPCFVWTHAWEAKRRSVCMHGQVNSQLFEWP